MTNVSNEGPIHYRLRLEDTLDYVIGLELDDLVEVGLRTARLPVTPGVCQPMGIAHGGVYAVIAESLASRGTADGVLELGKVPLGMSNNTSFLRPARRRGHPRRGARHSSRSHHVVVGHRDAQRRRQALCHVARHDRGARSAHVKVAYGFFSFTEVTDPAEHHSYNEWHMLDHLPEQFPLPGIVYGQRWVSTPADRAARAVSEPDLDPIHYVTCYLMAEPIDETLADFFRLGGELHRLDRFHQQRAAHLTGPFAVKRTVAAPAALVSAEAVPYRAHRGIYVIVEELSDTPSEADERWLQDAHEPALRDEAGVAGLWTFVSNPQLTLGRWTPGARRITLCWLDGDPLAVAAHLAPRIDERRERFGATARMTFSGPFETITPWKWDWFD